MAGFTKEVTEYLRLFQQGDKTQFDLLYKSTAMHVYNVAYYYLFNKNSVKDVVEDVFLRIWRHVDTFDFEKDGYNWMCRITQRVAYDYNKKEARIAHSEQQFAREQEILSYNHDLEHVEFLMLIDNLALDETDKYIIRQKVLEGKTHEDIGKDLNVSKAAISQRLKKIGKIIKKKIKNQ